MGSLGTARARKRPRFVHDGSHLVWLLWSDAQLTQIQLLRQKGWSVETWKKAACENIPGFCFVKSDPNVSAETYLGAESLISGVAAMDSGRDHIGTIIQEHVSG
jgi:hypothetical protein